MRGGSASAICIMGKFDRAAKKVVAESCGQEHAGSSGGHPCGGHEYVRIGMSNPEMVAGAYTMPALLLDADRPGFGIIKSNCR